MGFSVLIRKRSGAAASMEGPCMDLPQQLGDLVTVGSSALLIQWCHFLQARWLPTRR